LHYLSQQGMHECVALCIQNSCDPAKLVHWKNKKGLKAIDMCDTESDKGRILVKEILQDGVKILNKNFLKLL
jgi:hypothetical protein